MRALEANRAGPGRAEPSRAIGAASRCSGAPMRLKAHRAMRRSRGGKLVFSFGRANKLSDGDVTVVKAPVGDPRIMIIATEKSSSSPPAPSSLYPAGETDRYRRRTVPRYSAATINRRRRGAARKEGPGPRLASASATDRFVTTWYRRREESNGHKRSESFVD